MQAIIDLGTNTFHLLIAEVKDGNIIEHKKLQIPVKIGEGGINQKKIAPAAFERGMEALRQFRETLDEYAIEKIKAFGTSAIRDAENGHEFIEQAKQQFNLLIEVISGDEEARLIYEGVKHTFPFPDENVLVMDIGGGSVEFIIGHKATILWKGSYQLGAARLIEQFHKHDPITPDEIQSLKDYLITSLQPLRNALRQFPAHILIGSAGSFETLVEILTHDLNISITPLSPLADEISLIAFEQFYEVITTRDEEQRSQLHGMADFRVEMIVVSSILMSVVIRQFNIKQLITSDFSLKEGMLLG